ncbi:MAG TPA: ADOP family duplicated permease [Vicinamibacterales bacterium]|jgi:putative ABC transport system permease protein|nr:ADOP family duplicated permease [Vicinamibacterales bacterium]
MRPDERELDDEIRGHLALSVQDRIERGQDPAAARRDALAELGYVGDLRESIRRVWYSRAFDAVTALGRDLRFALRSLSRSRGFSLTVVLTLALGIGANAAIFSVVRAVLLRPLVNRDEDRLIYIRQSAPGIGQADMTFSVPEVQDLTSQASTIAAFGDFSTVDFALTGLHEEPRIVHAGVVSGSFFDVMGLRPVLGRLITAQDDGPNAAGVAVLTYRFWTTTLNSDPHVVGKAIRLGQRTATIVGVLEPSIPYPADTELIANIVTSPHHMGALMRTNRSHRMTELFGRLKPGVTLEQARADLTAAHAAMLKAHAESYSARAHVQLSVTRLRDQIVSPARTVLLVLLAAAAVVFLIAVSNVANLILARSVRREGELAIRAALGAGTAALRRTLLAESLVLCCLGALFGVLLAQPFVTLVARYAARFSVRAVGITVDSSVVWVGAALALAAALLLAFVPRLPSAKSPAGLGVPTGSISMTPATRRRLRVFATSQIAFSFVLLAGAGMLVTTLVRMQETRTGYDLRRVVVFDVPLSAPAATDPKTLEFFKEAMRRVAQLPGVRGVSIAMTAPWRDAGAIPLMQVTAEGYSPENGEENPHAKFRIVAPGLFDVLGVPLIAGRDFSDRDVDGSEPVVIISESVARRFFGTGEAVNRRIVWTDPLARMMGPARPQRIVGVVADVDDENVVPSQTMAVYRPVAQMGIAERLFVRVDGDPHSVIAPVTRIIRDLSPEQPVERAATLEEIRSQLLAPERVNAFVISGFAGIALLIAVVGVAGVLAFSVSARTREFGVRLAIGSDPRDLLRRVLSEGARIAIVGILAGAAGGYLIGRVAARFFVDAQVPGALPAAAAAAVLVAAALTVSLVPAARASHVDVLQALRTE